MSTRLPALRRSALIAALAALAAGLPATPAFGQDGDATRARQALLRASQVYSGLGTICADFRQVIEIGLLGESRESAGELCQRRPNLFSMRFSDPDRDAVVADGEVFWIYYASVSPDQVIQLPLDPNRGGLDFYREFLDDPVEKYRISDEGMESVDGTPTVQVGLVPRERTSYRRATVWIEPGTGMIRRVEVEETSGTVRRLTLSDIRLDPVVPASTFTFQVPDGVTVVRR